LKGKTTLQNFKQVTLSNSMKPILRALKFTCLHFLANWRSHLGSYQSAQPMAFIIGCGRSGTTVLGRLLSEHPHIGYHYEPYHLWAAVDCSTDVLNLYHKGEARLMLAASDVSPDTQTRFNRLIRNPKRDRLTIEKTPLNAFRIGYIDALAPGSKFIHIVRDGIDVTNSIAHLAQENSYKIAGLPALNQWWGIDYSKWKALAKDGARAGYYPKAIAKLAEHSDKGAYEWLVSLKEVDRWRQSLGARLYELNYNEFTRNPSVKLQELCQFLELDAVQPWLSSATQTVRIAKSSKNTLQLPAAMCDDFNAYQARYHFSGRATCHSMRDCAEV
jgi:hypothetical protein